MSNILIHFLTDSYKSLMLWAYSASVKYLLTSRGMSSISSYLNPFSVLALFWFSALTALILSDRIFYISCILFWRRALDVGRPWFRPKILPKLLNSLAPSRMFSNSSMSSGILFTISSLTLSFPSEA